MKILNFSLMIKDPLFWLLVLIVLVILVDDFIKRIGQIKKFKQNLILVYEKLNGKYYDENTKFSEIKLDEYNNEEKESDNLELLNKIPNNKNKILSSIAIFNISNQKTIITLIIHDDSNIKGIHTRIVTNIKNEYKLYLNLVSKSLRTRLNNEKREKIGLERIDKMFYLESNDNQRIKEILSNDEIYNILIKNKNYVIKIEENNLIIDLKGIINEKKDLIELILFSNLISSKINQVN